MKDRAETYRFRAEEIRTLCAGWLDDEARTMLARVARDYDRMADHLEAREATAAHALAN